MKKLLINILMGLYLLLDMIITFPIFLFNLLFKKQKKDTVVFVADSFYPTHIGGLECAGRDLATGLVEKGWKVEVLTKDDAMRARSEEVYQGYHLTRFGLIGTESWYFTLRVFLWLLRHFRDYLTIYFLNFSYSKSRKSIYIPQAAVAWFFKTIFNKYIVLRLSGGTMERTPQHLYHTLSSWKWNLYLDSVSLFTSLSKDEYDFLVSKGRGYKTKKVFNGVNVEQYYMSPQRKDKRKKELRIDEDKVIVGFIGRFTARKGADLLLRVWKRMKPKNALLLLIGTSQEDMVQKSNADEVKELANKCGDSVIFLGRIDDPWNYLGIYDIMVCPYRVREGMSNTILQGMAAKNIIIASEIPGIIGLCKSGHDAIFFPENDEMELEKILREVIDDAEKYSYLAENAFERVKREFHMNKVVDFYHQIFSSPFKNETKFF
jgi:glycosyltransferase involved in cell wall biosynthesis